MARVSRRGVLLGGALAAGGAVAGAAGTAAVTGEPAPVPAAAYAVGTATVPFHGPHQAGVETPPPAHAVFLAHDLASGVDRAAVGRLMRLLTDDARRLTSGEPALADTEPELAALPAALTVTFGFGPGLFDAAGVADARPESVATLPAFPVDRLEDRWSGGDLLIQICAEDPLSVAHAQRMLVKDARAFATVRWVQRGFRRAAGVGDPATTQRNVLGQLDGTGNPAPGSEAFAATVWTADGPPWMHGGTTVVLRRIRAELESWDAADRSVKELAVGRALDTGAPLTGTAETDVPDFTARDSLGLPVIDPSSHIRLASAGGARIYRRPYNYDEGPAADGTADTGLVFASFQADVGRQFVPVQRALAEKDLLNAWITPVGSAVFAVPPGSAAGGWIGETLLG